MRSGHRLVTSVGPTRETAEVDGLVKEVVQPEMLGESGRQELAYRRPRCRRRMALTARPDCERIVSTKCL